MITRRKTLILVGVILALTLLPLTAQAVVYTWNGTTSSAWNVNTNWDVGTFPNSSTSQAVINSDPNSREPVTIGSGTTITLGGAAPSLTINGTAAATALDIASGGTLSMTGTLAGITNDKIITIEGALNAAYSTGATTYHYSIGGLGSITLAGGTINGSGTRSYWDINEPINGYGTLSNRIYNYSTITANNATPITITGTTFSLQGGTLAATGSGSFTNNGTISGYGLISAPLNSAGSINANVANQTMQITGNATLNVQRG